MDAMSLTRPIESAHDQVAQPRDQRHDRVDQLAYEHLERVRVVPGPDDQADQEGEEHENSDDAGDSSLDAGQEPVDHRSGSPGTWPCGLRSDLGPRRPESAAAARSSRQRVAHSSMSTQWPAAIAPSANSSITAAGTR